MALRRSVSVVGTYAVGFLPPPCPIIALSSLIWLSVIAVGLYLFQGLFDILRSQMLVRFGANVDRQIAPLVHRVVMDMPRFGYSAAEASERGRDVDTVRGFLSGAGPVALFDLPWIPVYLVFVWLLHPVLGMLTLGGALFLACLTIAAELLSRRHAKEMTRAAIQRNNVSDNHVRNGDILYSMGMTDRAVDRFESANRRHLDTQTATSDIAGTFAGISKVLRMMLQSATLGVGAYLTIQGEMSAGAIIASSIVTGSTLPVSVCFRSFTNVSVMALTETMSPLIQRAVSMQWARRSPVTPEPAAAASRRQRPAPPCGSSSEIVQSWRKFAR